jgi:hypothetical protein
MSNPTNDRIEEIVREQGYEQGYEDCMKEWLGFLRKKHEVMESFMNSSDKGSDVWLGAYHYSELIKALIKERWHVEIDVKDIVNG